MSYVVNVAVSPHAFVVRPQWHPMKYASMLAEKMQKHGSTAW